MAAQRVYVTDETGRRYYVDDSGNRVYSDNTHGRAIDAGTQTSSSSSLSGDRHGEGARADHDTNPDPITGSPGSHPGGTAIGSASGAATGAALGAIGGPVGALIGGVAGAITGAAIGHGVGEWVDPTEEEGYWSKNHSSTKYGKGRKYDELAPAYRYGYSSYGSTSSNYRGKSFDDVEHDLQGNWDSYRGSDSNLSWDDARPAVRDAYSRVYDRDTGSSPSSQSRSST
jgi:hypothetical protein